MSKSDDPGSTSRGNTMPGRDFLRDRHAVMTDVCVDADDDMDADVVQKCQADSVEVPAEYNAGVDGVCVCGDRMVRRRSQDGRASDKCDGTDVLVDANMPRRRSAISAAATSSKPLSSDFRSSAAMMKLVR